MNNAQWRMESAKLAQAYMNSGTTPFNAAKMAGFRTVADMEDAIRSLSKGEAVKAVTEEHAPMETGRALPALVLTGEWRSEHFLIKRYAASGDKPEMVRIFAGGRISFVYFEPGWGRELMNIIAAATGQQGDISAEGRREELEKAQAEIMKLKKELANANEELMKAIQRPMPDTAGLEKELEETKILNQMLRDKLVEIVLGI